MCSSLRVEDRLAAFDVVDVDIERSLVSRVLSLDDDHVFNMAFLDWREPS